MWPGAESGAAVFLPVDKSPRSHYGLRNAFDNVE
jgi:hypothetical protein